MVAKRIVRALTVVAAGAAALITACKSSTGPSDPFAGSWSVSVANLIYNGDTPPDTGTVSPKPFTLTITKNGQSYSASWPGLVWSVTVQGIGAVQAPIPASSTTPGTVTFSGDSLVVHIPESYVGTSCELDVRGAYQGSGAQGLVTIEGGNCGSGLSVAAIGSWTATKQ